MAFHLPLQERGNVCVDYDDVITDTLPALLEFYWQRYGKRFAKEDVWTYDLWKIWEVPRKRPPRSSTSSMHQSSLIPWSSVPEQCKGCILSLSARTPTFQPLARLPTSGNQSTISPREHPHFLYPFSMHQGTFQTARMGDRAPSARSVMSLRRTLSSTTTLRFPWSVPKEEFPPTWFHSPGITRSLHTSLSRASQVSRKQWSVLQPPMHLFLLHCTTLKNHVVFPFSWNCS